jgi:hypothetical protein
MLIEDDREFQEIFSAYITDVGSKEVDLKDIPKVLKDHSINFSYDLEPVKDTIYLNHSHLK